MGSSPVNFPASFPATLSSIWVLSMILSAGPASFDIDHDRAECSDQLVGLAACLPYVGGAARAPPLDCCSGLKQVVQKSTKCLCILIKDRDDPELGLTINVTLALGLPTTCHTPTNLTRCVDLLHLASNSTDAKLFKDFEKTNHTQNSIVPAANEIKGNANSSTSADSKSDGGHRKKYRSMEIVIVGVSALFFVFPDYIF